MKKTIIAVAVVCAAAFSFGPASADSLKIVVKPRNTVVKRVIIRQPCYYKTTKVYKANKTVITKKRICP